MKIHTKRKFGIVPKGEMLAWKKKEFESECGGGESYPSQPRPCKPSSAEPHTFSPGVLPHLSAYR
jgi:hypothetical protein